MFVNSPALSLPISSGTPHRYYLSVDLISLFPSRNSLSRLSSTLSLISMYPFLLSAMVCLVKGFVWWLFRSSHLPLNIEAPFFFFTFGKTGKSIRLAVGVQYGTTFSRCVIFTWSPFIHQFTFTTTVTSAHFVLCISR